jgi:FkbM family methyltransferase
MSAQTKRSSVLPPSVACDTAVGWVLLPEQDQLMRPWIQEHGMWEPAESAALAAMIRPGHVVVEIGAHVGYLTLLMARATGSTGRLLAIEANPDNYALLAENVRRSGLDHVHTVHAAAWRSAGELTMGLSADNTGDHRVYVHPDVTGTVTVPSVRVDDLLEATQRIDVVKVDAQGVDHVALEGMRRTLARSRPVVLLEFWPDGIRQFGDDPLETLHLYDDLEYDACVLEAPGLGGQAQPTEILDVAENDEKKFCTLILHPRRTGVSVSHADVVRAVLARGPAPSSTASNRSARALLRRGLLRAMRPYTAYQRQVDERLADGLADAEARVDAMERARR